MQLLWLSLSLSRAGCLIRAPDYRFSCWASKHAARRDTAPLHSAAVVLQLSSTHVPHARHDMLATAQHAVSAALLHVAAWFNGLQRARALLLYQLRTSQQSLPCLLIICLGCMQVAAMLPQPATASCACSLLTSRMRLSDTWLLGRL
jgi:hypothetical protein